MRNLTSLFGSSRNRAVKKPLSGKAKPIHFSQAYRTKLIDPVPAKVNIPYLGEHKLRELTKSTVWNWECFRAILICLSQRGPGYYLHSSRRPDRVFLDGLQTAFAELRRISIQKQGRETSQVVFVDIERSCLVISGKTHIGSIDKVNIDTTSEPGRKSVQLPVLTIHVHPGKGDNSGLSDQDYISFLSDRRLIIMMICFQGGNLFAMKTSSTPSPITPDTAKKLISVIRNDIHAIWSDMNLPKSILAFNKAVCTEFGLTLYQTEDPEGNIAQRIEVTNI